MGRQDAGGDSWTTIESDPGVFTELIEKIGVSGVQVEELWSTDLESLKQLSPVYGLVFLFKYVAEQDTRPTVDPLDQGSLAHPVFFANQVITNACATQAILSILLNIPKDTPGVSLGTELESLQAFAQELPSDMKGLAISNSDLIRSVHNSFARPEPFVPDEDEKHGKSEDAFHFIAYLPVGGVLYELDGLKRGPIILADNLKSKEEWLEKVGPIIGERMEKYAAGEVRFNLLALCGDRRAVFQQQLCDLEFRMSAMQSSMSGDHSMEGGPHLGESIAGAVGLGELDAQREHLTELLEEEHRKRRKWSEENERRRHNYIPFLFSLLTAMGEGGALGPLIAAAKNPALKKQRPQEAE